MAGHLLVVAFGPFPRVPRNPSAEVARRLGADRRLALRLGAPPRVLILPTAYASLDTVLAPALAQGPAAVLMIGVAGRARRPRVEARGTNRVSRLFPDASGRTTGRLTLDPGGPALRRAGALARLALVRLRAAGLDAYLSTDAGRYLCNAAYYRGLAAPVPVLFLHIPPTDRPRPLGARDARRARETQPSRLAEAFAAVATLLAARAQRGTGSFGGAARSAT
jgi:pyroglutamyl-peptidase